MEINGFHGLLHFGGWVVSKPPLRRELSRGTRVIATGSQVFDLVDYLVENRE
jgi:DNA-binding winged helix-turn-helix (wHTH) protein